MIVSRLQCCALSLALLLAAGCHGMHGKPGSGVENPRPDAVQDFATLYRQNCSGCHGDQGHNGPAIDLANPVYQSLVDDVSLRGVIANGYPGTLMPAFAQSSGGMLTDLQVTALADGMRSQWRKPGTLDGQNAPPYHAGKPGDIASGQKAYITYCAACHTAGKQARAPGGSVTDGSYLALVSDQALRTLVIAGRSDLGTPDWRNNVPGHPMSDQEVTDVVAWLASQRSQTPGQPYPQHP